MSRNLLDHARENRDMEVLKQAFQSIGYDCDFTDINGAAEAIRKLSTVPTVVNATLMAGPGIKVTPIERKGYKISANDDATLTSHINNKYRKGTSLHNVLDGIVNHDIPKAIGQAIRAPRVTDIEVFKVYDDGIDYYTNPYFGTKGRGRKSGLQPCAWYVRLYTISQVEPLYVCLSAMVEDLRRDLLIETRREADKAVAAAIEELSEQLGRPIKWPCRPPHKPCHGHHRPERPVEPEIPDVPENPELPEEPSDDTEGPIIYDQPNDPDTPDIKYDDPVGCPICDREENFGGYTDDDDFNQFLKELDEDDE